MKPEAYQEYFYLASLFLFLMPGAYFKMALALLFPHNTAYSTGYGVFNFKY
jgi:hypothetical protein